jgi:hypothetical protein
MNTTTIIAVVFAAIIGGVSGYWWRGQVLLMQEMAAIRAPAQSVTLAPPSTEPAPWISGNPGPAKR